ncbi:ADP-ribosylglycohydrolase family protein [candidate division KSB1 bacterium]|nr:ADP-ribosylglycohydrolase family protein [candidate division KSB1 bacterium]MBL7093203.1 ADP-ribosylglycohydrolase family protein [candidate division KSB1 bacterium]
MKTKILCILLIVPLMFSSCAKKNIKTIQISELKDKIAGGWAGKMIGVSYGAPTEFRALGTTYDKEIVWEPDHVNNSIGQDDMYVQMSFMMAMDKYGIDAPAEKFAESYANAGYQLWCANVQARKNFFDGIMPPMSGHPENSLWADAIDFQIEADYIGFMCPGMPQTSNEICDKIGHIMNYGDGVYGGMFVCALYTEAFFEKDMNTIVKNALLAIPAESEYAQCVQDVIDLHAQYPENWRSAWKELNEKWLDTDISGPLHPFNIDAKINGAFIVMGLLYGDGDFGKTMEVSIRCGQDSDCNPSNAAAVLGIRDGYSSIPEKWKGGIPAIADSVFIFTEYSFNKVVDNTLKYAKQLIEQNGGTVNEDVAQINMQVPKAPAKLEVSFPNLKPLYRSGPTEDAWTWKGAWKIIEVPNIFEQSVNKIKTAKQKGAQATFKFKGTGVMISGVWNNDHGKADVYIDGKLDRTIDAYYWVANEGNPMAFLYHNVTLADGDHEVRIVLSGKKNPKAIDTKFTISGAVVYGVK